MRSRVFASSLPLASAPLSPRYPSSAAGLLPTTRDRLGTEPSSCWTASSRGWLAKGEAAIEGGMAMRDIGAFSFGGAEQARPARRVNAVFHLAKQCIFLTLHRCICCNNQIDRLEAMTVFVAVADLAGFAPAARRLGLSPSAVTRLVAGLEERLGARLLQRTTRSVTLTDAGIRYLERVRRILAEVAEAVTAPNVFGRLHVAPLMCAFLAKYPAVRGNLTLSDRILNLVEEGIDVAVRIGMLDDSSDIARTVGSTRRVVVASPSYLARRKKPRRPADLARHDIIQFTALSPTPEWRFTREGETRRVSFSPRYVTNSADAAIGHAELGGGLAMVLSYQVEAAIRAGRLEVVLAPFEPPPRPIQIVYPTTRLLSAKVRAFVELATKTCEWTFLLRS